MIPLLRHTFTRRIFNTMVFELMALNLCFSCLMVSPGIHWQQASVYPALTLLFAVCSTGVVQFSLWSFGLYSREVVYSGDRVLKSLSSSFLFSALLLLPVCWLFSLSGVNVFDATLKFYLVALLAFMSVIGAERALILKLLNGSTYLGNILILGTGPATRQVISEARRKHGRTLRIVGVLAEPGAEGEGVEGSQVLGSLDQIEEVVRAKGVRGILISLPIHSRLIPTGFLLKCKLHGIEVMDSSEFYEGLVKKVLLERLEPMQFLLSSNTLMTRSRWMLKLCIERLLALVLLVVTSPLFLLTSLLIKLTSPGPVFYAQARVGRDGRAFKLYKFRSMVPEAEEDGKAVWAHRNDARVTPIGKVIRKFRIDELPQLINVIKGEMAFVGPRPERPEFVDELNREIPFYSERHLVPPGITGWAQVAYPYGSSIDDAREKLRYDLYYLEHMSVFFDLLIILSTVRTVMFGGGGR